MPEEFRKLVEQYFRSLAKIRQMKSVRLAVVLLLGVATAAAAQFGGRFQGWGPRGYPAKFANAEDFGRGFNFCRGVYTSGRREAGGQGWSTDYPDAELNFSIRLSELTKTRVARDNDGDAATRRRAPDRRARVPVPVPAHGGRRHRLVHRGRSAGRCAAYLLKGGFVWVDDFWGTYAWNNWVSQLARVLPPADYPIRRHPARSSGPEDACST